MNDLTILTPSYNRASLLPRLYESLREQSCKNFEWLLIDDGSQDNTELLAETWMTAGDVTLRYIRKENGGKHTALNIGMAYVKTKLVFIVDSDDWLPENAVEIILNCHERYKSCQGVCGYSFLRFYPDGRVNEAYFPENGKIDTYVNVRINGNIAGDKAEVFFTDILRQYPFPVYGKEKFLPEDLVWVKMSGPYRMVHLNECVYYSEYLEGGLTRSGRKMKLHSPRGMMARSFVYLQDETVNWKTKIKMALLYNVYWYAADSMQLTPEERDRKNWLIGICRIPGLFLYRRWKRKYGTD